MSFCGSAYLVLASKSYRRRWRQAEQADTAWMEMIWLVMIPLILVALACAAIPVFGN
jgi:hypothetical protein